MSRACCASWSRRPTFDDGDGVVRGHPSQAFDWVLYLQAGTIHALTALLRTNAAQRNIMVPARFMASRILALVVGCDCASCPPTCARAHPRVVGGRRTSAMIALEEHTIISAPVERCFDLARSVEVHLAGNIHWGEAAVASCGVTSGLIGLSQSVTWQARHFGIRQHLTSKITALERPTYFQDVAPRRIPIHASRPFLQNCVRNTNRNGRHLRVFSAVRISRTNRRASAAGRLHAISSARTKCRFARDRRVSSVAAISTLREVTDNEHRYSRR